MQAQGLPVQGLVVTDLEVIDCDVDSEAHYLCALLNSQYMNEVAREYPWTWGHVEFGPFEAIPIPKFDTADWRHIELARLSVALHERATEVDISERPARPVWQYLRALGPELERANDLAWDVLQEAAG
jgi:hypothetical protein